MVNRNGNNYHMGHICFKTTEITTVKNNFKTWVGVQACTAISALLVTFFVYYKFDIVGFIKSWAAINFGILVYTTIFRLLFEHD